MLWPRSGNESFFRAPVTVVRPPALPEAGPTDAPLPTAALDVALGEARLHIERGELVAPEGGNAMTSILEAWHADPASPGVREATAAFNAAMGERAARHVRDREDARARALVRQAGEFARATGQVGSAAQARMEETVRKAAVDRAEAAARTGDRDGALAAITLAREFGLPAAAASQLRTRVAALVDTGGGERVESRRESAGRLTDRPVTRADYERFVQATGRKSSICRERASLLRVLAPRDWRNPGFQQSQGDPVVCVSVQDAEAYALWLGAREGRRYRIPTGGESAAVAAQTGPRGVGLWLRDCGSNCQQRQVGNGSGRAQGLRPSSRGYDDVGFRLLRER